MMNNKKSIFFSDVFTSIIFISLFFYFDMIEFLSKYVKIILHLVLYYIILYFKNYFFIILLYNNVIIYKKWGYKMNKRLIERFLKYVKIDTKSDPISETFPSTMKQKI